MDLHINGKYYREEEILAGKNIPDDELLRKAVNIIKSWLQGQKVFKMNTSGSTGKPKAIDIHRKQIEASVNFTGEALQLQRNQVSLICLNLDFIAGFMMLIRSVELRMKMIIIPPVANPLTGLNDNERIDFTALVPLQLQAILDTHNGPSSLNRIDNILIGGGAVNIEIMRRIQKLESQIFSTYGMTETVSHIALRRLNGRNKQAWFQAFPEVKIGQDSRGCLTVQSILTNHHKLVTNDKVELIGQNRFRWLGRIDFVINSGGIKIQIEQMEQMIASIFAKEAITNNFIISSIPDPRLGERVILVIEGRIEKDPAYILSKLKQELPRHYSPRDIFKLAQFPRTMTQKVDRNYIQKTLLSDEK